MDYKELIRLLRDESNCDVLDYIDDAAYAIETLLAERDAAVNDLSNGVCRCDTCIYHNRTLSEYPCNNCKEDGGLDDNWQWRGPQEEDVCCGD